MGHSGQLLTRPPVPGRGTPCLWALIILAVTEHLGWASGGSPTEERSYSGRLQTLQPQGTTLPPLSQAEPLLQRDLSEGASRGLSGLKAGQ